MEVFPDPILVAAFLPGFLVAVVASWLILWKPLLEWMDERDQAVTGARAEALRLDEQIDLRLQEVESRLQSVRAEISELRTSGRAESAAAEAEVLAAARTEVEQKLSEAAAQIGEQSEIARRGLADASRAIADDMASQILGRPVQA
ncbi:MAG: hypothetical protein EA397_12605 [Deltaproteobacteria bacterium]|nr:MAG: hypothetical protein EA397_12605 [Deltaproteobacteria bacterium]